MTSRLISVNLGVATEVPWTSAASGRTGIDKRPVPGRVAVRAGGLDGDFIGEPAHHGGEEKAAYAYAREDAAWWERELGRDIPPGGFGENLSTSGLDVTGAVIGERWSIGTALFQVTIPRTPCTTFAGFWGVPDLVKRFTARGAPGAYLRVVTEGEIGAGDTVEIVHRPAHGVTIGETFRALSLEPALLPCLLTATDLPDRVRERVQRRLAEPAAGTPAN